MVARLKLARQGSHWVEVAWQTKTNKTQFHRYPFLFDFCCCSFGSKARQPHVALPRSGGGIFRCFAEVSR
jgi:hypothetical protein